jgi:hypothetical protein
MKRNNHFVHICPKFNNLRFILLDSIQTLIPNNNNIDINIDLLKKNKITQNKCIMRGVQLKKEAS